MIDLALRVEEPPALTKSSTTQEKDIYDRWERSNRLSLMLVKSHICKSIRGSIPECPKVTDFMKAIEEQFVSSDKALANTLMKKLSDPTYEQYYFVMHGDVGVKRNIINENSSTLWHRRLVHISIDRIKRARALASHDAQSRLHWTRSLRVPSPILSPLHDSSVSSP
ncbi:hypothetical protein LWI28_009158 [Acer negundo]|uniref:GAG-pre-integrase domain-containing protein n=1 Tax=Acer negundo TaxID=4023 RepID=A0AAD5NPS2_ACENE|nr:hypothetical protein LWI28_009158 [Acer negundo]